MFTQIGIINCTLNPHPHPPNSKFVMGRLSEEPGLGSDIGICGEVGEIIPMGLHFHKPSQVLAIAQGYI